MVVDLYNASQESLDNLKELRKTLAELKLIEKTFEEVHESGKSVDVNKNPSPHSSADPLDDVDAYLAEQLAILEENGLVYIDDQDIVTLTEHGKELMSKKDLNEVLDVLEKLEDKRS